MAVKNSTTSASAKETAAADTVKETKTVKKQKKVQLDDYVNVQSCVTGALVWQSLKTGYVVTWNEFGEINPLQVSDLLDMRNGSKSFFINNWVAIVGNNAQEVMDYLQISKYYKDIKTAEDLEDIILGTPEDVEDIVSSLSQSMKEAIIYKAQAMYEDGSLDSAKTISAIEKATGMSLNI